MMHTWQVSGVAFRRLNSNCARNGARLRTFIGQCRSFGKIGGYHVRLGVWFRTQNIQVAKECVRQFEFITAQRVRRSIQIFTLYTKLCDEVALKELWRSWRNRIERNSRYFLVSAIGVTTYNWKSERITDDEVCSYNQEIERVHELRDSTVTCTKCQLRIVVNQPQAGIKYCSCDGVTAGQDCTLPLAAERWSDGWQPYIELQDMLVWRKQELNSGLYAYKVYGTFADVSAEDFLQVQIDINYRKEWDATAEELRIVETDPELQVSKDRSTDIIYWRMIWPRLFANRDYVYQRRWVVDRDKKLIVIVSKVTKHPEVPNRPRTCRVTTYWSYMVIKPYTDLDQPGVEFCLTYFDDPGVIVLPNVITWIAESSVPQFLRCMRQASEDYQKYKVAKRGSNEVENAVAAANDGLSEKYAAVDSNVEDGEREKGREGRAGRRKRDNSLLWNSNDTNCSTDDVLRAEKAIDKKGNDVDKDKLTDETKDFMPEESHGILHHFSLSRLFV